jgi:hypothetical protein
MNSPLIRWTLRAGLGSVLLLALPVFPSMVTDSSVVQAAEKADLLDINSAKLTGLATKRADKNGSVKCVNRQE